MSASPQYWILILSCFLISERGLSQQEAHNWYFGLKSGITFTGTSPAPLSNGQIHSFEGCAATSAGSGNLLFYTNGDTIWNRMHQVMPNGAGLNGNSSATQSSIIVKKPGSVNVYYVFTLAQMGGPAGLQYSVVDMGLSSGNGSVTLKNVSLYSPSTEKLAAIRHCNGADYWIVSHAGNSANYTSYLLTGTGVSSTAVISTGAATHGVSGGQTLGQMKISPTGKKIAAAATGHSIIEISDFDVSTGSVSNSYILDSTFSAYGCEFSTDGTKLYATSHLSGTGPAIFQWDLCAGTPAAIVASKTQVAQPSVSTYAMQLGPDGKIYVSRGPYTDYVGAINHPNTPGAGCNYQDSAILVPGKAMLGLPSFASDFFRQSSAAFSYTLTKDHGCHGIRFSAPVEAGNTTTCVAGKDPTTSFYWQFGDTLSSSDTSTLQNPEHIFSSPGTYTVSLYVSGNCFSESLSNVITLSATVLPSISGSDSICAGESTNLTANGYPKYVWSTGSQASSITVIPLASTVYTVTGVEGACESSQTFTVTVQPCTGLYENRLKEMTFFPNPAKHQITLISEVRSVADMLDQEGRVILSAQIVNGENIIDISKLIPGAYLLRIKAGHRPIICRKLFVY